MPKPWFFPIFQLPIFAEPYLITQLKQAISPYFGFFFGTAVLQYLAIFYENLH